jgi:hypothetical protein
MYQTINQNVKKKQRHRPMLYTCSKVVFMFIIFKMQCIMFLTQPVRNCKVAFTNIYRIDSFQILCKMIGAGSKV